MNEKNNIYADKMLELAMDAALVYGVTNTDVFNFLYEKGFFKEHPITPEVLTKAVEKNAKKRIKKSK